MSDLPRRHMLAGGLAAAAAWPVLGGARAAQFDQDPFRLGVASGYPRPDGMILWTRLLFPEPELPADPFAAVETPDNPPVTVHWEVAEDEGFGRPVQSGNATAAQDFAHSVHVDVTGLAPDRVYFYRFRAGDAVSPVGRTRTAPLPDAANTQLTFAFAACQQYEQGFYSAYRDMAERQLDLVVHLGDYIYERSWGTNLVRSHGAGWPTRLDEYRARYALYRSDPNLQAAHAAAPWVFIWDDHEVLDNYADDTAPDAPPREAFLAQRRAAYQAWYEHMPVPIHPGADFSNLDIYGRYRFGGLLDLVLLDARQYKSQQVKDAADDTPDRTVLGEAQERWLDASLRGSDDARWTVIAQPTLLSERDLEAGAGTRYALDGWDGYRAARGRLLQSIDKAGLRNPLIIGGDVHAFFASDVKEDFAQPDSRTVASEFVTGAITSNAPSDSSIRTALAENPHLKAASNRHGYALMTLTPDKAQCDFVGVSDRKVPDATAQVFQSLAVLDGEPGVIRT